MRWKPTNFTPSKASVQDWKHNPHKNNFWELPWEDAQQPDVPQCFPAPLGTAASSDSRSAAWARAVADAAAALAPHTVSDRDSGAKARVWGCLRGPEKARFCYLCCSQNNLFTQNVLLGASPFWRGTEESTWQLCLSAHLLLSDLSLMRPIAL